jgi:signal transduction histidine kinase
LVDALDSLCEEFDAQSEIEVNFVHEHVPEPLPPELALCLFRIAQEGLRNVKKHSGASVVEVRLSGTAGGVHLSIADNGSGFSHSKVAKSSGLGLRSMQERLRLVGGVLEIHSTAGQGTIVEAWIRVIGDSVATNGIEVTTMKERIGG